MRLTAYYSVVGSRIEAATFSRVRSILTGLGPRVHTVGIITGWNPRGEQASKEYNAQANKKLMGKLREAGFGPIRINGKFFGNIEESLLIPNISRGEIVDLCHEFEQYGVIYGEKTKDSRGRPVMEFLMLDAQGKPLADPEVVVIGNQDITRREDMFSFMGGERPREPKPGKTAPTPKKFFIPFWDDTYSGAQPGEKPGQIKLKEKPSHEFA